MYPIVEEQKMRDLIDKLNAATKAYDEGNPTMSDKEWDDMYFDLVALEEQGRCFLTGSPTRKISYEVKNKLDKVEHNHPMLSLAKTKEISDIESFIGNKNYIAMEKLDGLTCSLRYVNGHIISAETRGDGIIGEDVLHNIITMDSVPKSISYKDELIVDGEVICDTETFNKYFAKDYKNPRNYAAGALRRLDANENKESGLTFVAWDIIKGFEDCKTLSSRLERLLRYNFTVVDHTFSSNIDINADINCIKTSAQEYNYPIDGVVFKYDNIEYYQSLGATDHHFRGGLAFKFYDEEYETILKDIVWGMGRTGILTPIGIFEPIDIEGSTIERASLHNISVMYDILHIPFVGQHIKVAKMNMIIPQITWAEEVSEGGDIDYPEVCPICGGKTAIRNNDGVKTLWCSNPTCDGKLSQKIDHYCSKKGLDIKGISEQTIEKLIDWGWLNSIKDIYSLKNHKSEWVQKAGFGEKSVQKILDAIEASKNCELYQFIAAIGIPLIGTTVAKEICKYYDTWEDFKFAVGGDWSNLDGFGSEMESAINNFDYTETDEIAGMLTFKQHGRQPNGVITSAAGLTFCITGKVSTWANRDSLKAYIESIGGKVVGSMSSKVNYLINNNNASTSSKNQKAKSLGIPIITEAEFLEAFGQK
jgi:DNA ligase (NAD+)